MQTHGYLRGNRNFILFNYYRGLIASLGCRGHEQSEQVERETWSEGGDAGLKKAREEVQCSLLLMQQGSRTQTFAPPATRVQDLNNTVGKMQ